MLFGVFNWAVVITLAISSQLHYLVPGVQAQGLSTNFYASTCPNIVSISRFSFAAGVLRNLLAPASLVRLSFHDCAVDVSDSSEHFNVAVLNAQQCLKSDAPGDMAFLIHTPAL